MKRTIALIIGLLMITGIALADGPRMQIAYTGLYTAGEESRSPVYSFRTGASYKVYSMGNGGAIYTVALAEYADTDTEKIKGAGVEVVYFPVAPIGKGFRVFLPLGSNVTEVENYENLTNITYWQGASGLGLYWDFNEHTALWVAGKVQMSEKLTTVNVGVGLSIATF